MKKIALVSALALLLVACLSGCAQVLSTPLSERAEFAQPAAQETQPAQEDDADALAWSGPSHLNMDRFLLAEEGISIKAESFCYDADGDGYVRLYLNNNTNEDITVSAEVFVNGEAVELPFAHEVEALGGLDCDLFLTMDELVAQGVTRIYDLSAVFTVESAGQVVLVSDQLVIDLAAL